MKILAIMFSLVYAVFSDAAPASLDQQLQAHGGLEQFRKFGTLEFDVRDCPFAKNGNVNDHHVVDLKSRKIYITAADYKLGWNGKEAWSIPKDTPLSVPPRFYISTPFYFFAMPFVLADPGTQHTAQQKKSVQGKQYNAVKVTFGQGVGDTPEDYYIGYFDTKTHQLHHALYIVSYPMFRQGKSVDQLELHAIVFDKWQKVNGLSVPQKVSFREIQGETLGKSHGSCSFENVSFRENRPDPKQFEPPAGAAIDSSLSVKQ